MAEKLTQAQSGMRAEEVRQALTHWGRDMEAMLNARFGKGKMGYFLSVFPYGGKAQVSWISSARAESLCGMLDGLSKHLAADKSGIVKPSKDEIGFFG